MILFFFQPYCADNKNDATREGRISMVRVCRVVGNNIACQCHYYHLLIQSWSFMRSGVQEKQKYNIWKKYYNRLLNYKLKLKVPKYNFLLVRQKFPLKIFLYPKYLYMWHEVSGRYCFKSHYSVEDERRKYFIPMNAVTCTKLRSR